MNIIILGADGFVGSNLLEDLEPHFNCFGSTRKKEKLFKENKIFFFDLEDETSWNTLLSFQPHCIINCIVNGAVKKAEDVKQALDINYLRTIQFYDFLSKHIPVVYLIHLGTTFEYDLKNSGLTEQTPCVPQTYYGISKLLTSRYLIEGKRIKNFTIIRPFNMFGPHDREEKIIPHLICAQRDKKPVALTQGLQVRDYFFVKDLSRIVLYLLADTKNRMQIINAGSGRPISIREIADAVAKFLPDYDPSLWQWGKLNYHEGGDSSFFNASDLLMRKGLVFTEFEQAIKATVAYYCSAKQIKNLC